VSLLTLIASSDDFLLEDRLDHAVAEACSALGGVEPELFGEEATPESVAVELRSPSLFSPTRVLVVSDVRTWLGASAPPGAPPGEAAGEVEPLVAVLSEALPDGVALVMGAWCGRKPKGKLVEAVTASGRFEWIPVPDPPKPWEDVLLSDQQRSLLENLLAKVAGEVRFTPDAQQLLLERLGFAPRLLVQEAGKLVAAASQTGEVDEQLVRELTLPRERSLEVVRDAVLQRNATALLDLVSAAGAGVPVRDWKGQRLDPSGLAVVLYAQVFNLLLQLLYLRRIAVAEGIEEELDPARTGDRGWHRRRFKSGLAPVVMRRLEQDPSPVARGGKLPSPWTVGQLFAGAGRYREEELVAALAGGGAVEVGLRGPLALEALSAWLARLLQVAE
jgi:hypothetical protein